LSNTRCVTTKESPLSTALVFFDQARQALAQARTVDEVKDIRDRAEALRLYTRQAGEGLEMQNWCAEIKLRAERCAGELLKAMEKRDGGDAMRAPFHREREVPPRLADLGISYTQSHRWQTIASLPELDFEAHLAETKAKGQELTSVRMYTRARAVQKAADRQVLMASTPGPLPPAVTLVEGAFEEVGRQIPDEAIDLILTDPPYGAEFVPALSNLGALASRALKPGGSLLMMYGQRYLPEALRTLGEYLDYQWTFSSRFRGPGLAVWSQHVHNHWKPIVWYVRGAYAGIFQGDVLVGGEGSDKRYHDWGQSAGAFMALIQRFTAPDAVILDPLCGGGTTGAAAVTLRRRFMGMDRDPAALAITRARLAALTGEGVPG
jgi:SAM-dependent methyltransferase